MRRLTLTLAIIVALSFGMGCGIDDEECTQLCTWWSQACTGETFQSCMNDCSSADQSYDDVAGCLASEPRSCVDASCCLGFIYWPEAQVNYCY